LSHNTPSLPPSSFSCAFTDTPTPEIYTLSLHDALPILPAERFAEIVGIYLRSADRRDPRASPVFGRFRGAPPVLILSSLHENLRSEEHTSELQSRENLVCRLLLEKKKKKK